MTALNVLIYPDDHLKVVCEPVTEVNDAIRKIVDDMFDTMYQEEGIGLAAPQVDILQRIITIDVEGDKKNQLGLELILKFWLLKAKLELKRGVYPFQGSVRWLLVKKK